MRETVGLLTFALRGARPRIQRLAYQFLVDNYDAVAARVPREARGYLPALAGAGCDVAARAAAEDFWKQRVQELEGGPRVLAQALERISLCAARREAQLPAIREFLRGY